jgi:hypothetical protein
VQKQFGGVWIIGGQCFESVMTQNIFDQYPKVGPLHFVEILSVANNFIFGLQEQLN